MGNLRRDSTKVNGHEPAIVVVAAVAVAFVAVAALVAAQPHIIQTDCSYESYNG